MKNLSKFEMNAVMGGAAKKSAKKAAKVAKKTAKLACCAGVSDELEEILDCDTPL